jgi:hypothetical protein
MEQRDREDTLVRVPLGSVPIDVLRALSSQPMVILVSVMAE